ncbi:MAG: phosphotyrosine protein phosphatase [Alphaproteobacteria bacterium MedPE-SWcel]|nr:MAG: phosphotyrosine protein phosphatase [Alphaproteobacteria bacterium MedPE-SWcel]
MQKILFVCLGNICRSPAAEAIFRNLSPELTTDSAGTSDYHIGDPPYAPMQAAARARGIAMEDLRARQFAAADFLDFDLIVAMDHKNRAAIEALRPVGVVTPVILMAPLAEGAGTSDVPDPYYTRDFDGCLDLLEAAATGLQRDLATWS